VKVAALLEQRIEIAKAPPQNLLPITIELVRAGDIIERLKTIWGTCRESPVY
jgi:hypothetical protein